MIESLGTLFILVLCACKKICDQCRYYSDERDLSPSHKFYKSLSEEPLEDEEVVSNKELIVHANVVFAVNHAPGCLIRM